MTAPLPVATSALSALAPSSRHSPKSAKAEDFTLPDPLTAEAANLPAEIEPDSENPESAAMLIPIAQPQPAPVTLQTVSAHIGLQPAPPEAAPADGPPPMAASPAPPPEVETGQPQGDPVALPIPERGQPTAIPTAAPTRIAPAANRPATSPATEAPNAEARADTPATAPTTPAADPKPQPAPTARATNGLPSAGTGTVIAATPPESREQPTGRDQRGSARAPAPPQPKADSTSPIAPFRMEAVAVAQQASATAAVMEAAPPASARLAAISPDLAADAPSHIPDVVVELVGADALDLTISAATPDSLERLSAAEPELRLELAQLGAEVEAIRMELRAQPGSEDVRPDRAGPDRAGPDRASQDRAQERADAAQTAQSNDQGRQGDRMMRQTEMRDTGNGRLAIGRTLRLTADAETSARDAIAGQVRIDRYA